MFPLRDENPRQRFPVVTILLIVTNLAVFFHQRALGDEQIAFILHFGLRPCDFFAGPPVPYASLATSMFLHGSWGHLLGNLWFLWIFGDNIEDFFGAVRFSCFYFAAGILAALTHVFLNPLSTAPMIGASGAISGILGAYLLLHPRIRLRTLIFLGFFIEIVRVPAGGFLAVWFFLQFVGGFGGNSSVAFAAHVGGFLAGMLLLLAFSSREARTEARLRAVASYQ